MQIPSQGLPPMSPTLRQVPYHAQAAVMPGVPNEAPLHPPYASAPAPQAGAWQHESPPTTPRLQVRPLSPSPPKSWKHMVFIFFACAIVCSSALG